VVVDRVARRAGVGRAATPRVVKHRAATRRVGAHRAVEKAVAPGLQVARTVAVQWVVPKRVARTGVERRAFRAPAEPRSRCANRMRAINVRRGRANAVPREARPSTVFALRLAAPTRTAPTRTGAIAIWEGPRRQACAFPTNCFVAGCAGSSRPERSLSDHHGGLSSRFLRDPRAPSAAGAGADPSREPDSILTCRLESTARRRSTPSP